MFIAQRAPITLLCSEERHTFGPSPDRRAALPNRAGGGESWMSINMQLLRS